MINWEIVQLQAKHKAADYARRKEPDTTSANYAKYFNGFYDGYMHDGGERESLRVMNEKLEREKAHGFFETPQYSTSTSSDLEGLI